MLIDISSMMCMSDEAPLVGFLTSQYGPFVVGDTLATPFEHPTYNN